MFVNQDLMGVAERHFRFALSGMCNSARNAIDELFFNTLEDAAQELQLMN